MTRLKWSEQALAGLNRLVLTHTPRALPPPRSGDPHDRRRYVETEDRIVIVSVEDSRTAGSTITR